MFNIKDTVYKKYPHLVQKLPSFVTKSIIKTFQSILCEKEFKELNIATQHTNGSNFADAALEHLNIKYTITSNEINNIPATGKLMVVANHITGASDAFSLVQIIANAREDKKVRMVVNGMLMGMKQAKDIMIPVDNINGKITKKSLEAINESLAKEEVVIIFPAGIVNRLSLRGLYDTPWKATFLKIANRTQTPILPIRIKSRNSILFYILSMLLPKKLTGLMLPCEFIKSGKMKPLHFNIGKVVPVKSFSDKRISNQEYVDMFYRHLYTLGTNKNKILETEITISQPNNRKILKEEVKKAEFLGSTADGKKIYLADAINSPFLLKELGRVREISFRAIGGGTGTARDNDLYDNYYRHLILWDEDDLEIVGAYRIGECKDIIDDKGEEGLYTYNLCNFNEHFKEYCENSVELGRSFVQPKYWGSRALDSLWQGVGAYLAHNPKIKFTYGTVTINADTPQKAVAALVYFYSLHFSCSTNMMKAKKPYLMSEENKIEFDALFKDISYKEGFIVLKSYLKDHGTSVPTLFKQYAELYDEGAVRFFDFSVNDDLFGVVEGFIIADNTRMKEAKRKRYIENFEKLQITDELTGLFNRSHFNDTLNSITKFQRKTDIDFVLVILEVNGSKSLDDKDLSKFANRLKKHLRDNDIIARWDDERFSLILKNVSNEQAKIILEKISSTLNINCSFGATMYKAAENINETFKRAENALNEAKNRTDSKILIY